MRESRELQWVHLRIPHWYMKGYVTEAAALFTHLHRQVTVSCHHQLGITLPIQLTSVDRLRDFLKPHRQRRQRKNSPPSPGPPGLSMNPCLVCSQPPSRHHHHLAWLPRRGLCTHGWASKGPNTLTLGSLRLWDTHAQRQLGKLGWVRRNASPGHGNPPLGNKRQLYLADAPIPGCTFMT